MKNKATLLNMISGLILQLFTLVSGFILPKIILIYFGSEVNGLVSSLNQFLSYITLVEGGITGVIVANLYKPIVDQDNRKISSVLITADRFYKKRRNRSDDVWAVFYFIGNTVIHSCVKVELSYEIKNAPRGCAARGKENIALRTARARRISQARFFFCL